MFLFDKQTVAAVFTAGRFPLTVGPDTVTSYLGHSRLSWTMLEWMKNRKKCWNRTFSYGKWQYYLHSSESSSMCCPIFFFFICCSLRMSSKHLNKGHAQDCASLRFCTWLLPPCSLPGMFPRLYRNFIPLAQNRRKTNFGNFSGHDRNRQSCAHPPASLHTFS